MENKVNTQAIIEYFHLDSDDPAMLEKALEAMWQRVGVLEAAIVSAITKNDLKTKSDLEAEVREISRLRVVTQDRIIQLRMAKY